MLAGRTLLLADDSKTIQKIVELTFSDNDVKVVCVNNGREALEQVDEVAPDVVLADVFMPQVNGYEVCEYIKQNEKLKHIPVMLLVGSFEPFDEAEARRVGADDILTKPFESIRRLLDKVGVLVGGRVPEELIPTAELPKPDGPEPEPEVLSEEELKISTADTRPLPPEMGQPLPEPAANKKMDKQTTMSRGMEAQMRGSEANNEALLDLGEYEPASASAVDDFVLDVDLDDIPDYPPVESAPRAPAFAGSSQREALTNWRVNQASDSSDWAGTAANSYTPTTDQMAKTQEFARPSLPTDTARLLGATTLGAGGPVSAEQLSPEVIDAIARRAVEQLSEKVVQEIAWEVVPQLAELMIKRQLEEKNS